MSQHSLPLKAKGELSERISTRAAIGAQISPDEQGESANGQLAFVDHSTFYQDEFGDFACQFLGPAF